MFLAVLRMLYQPRMLLFDFLGILHLTYVKSVHTFATSGAVLLLQHDATVALCIALGGLDQMRVPTGLFWLSSLAMFPLDN